MLFNYYHILVKKGKITKYYRKYPDGRVKYDLEATLLNNTKWYLPLSIIVHLLIGAYLMGLPL
jgi:hypothetical protein